MKHPLLTTLLAATLLVAGLNARATEVAGVRFDDRQHLEQQELVLNGAGLRSKFFIKVYAMGLYLPEKKTDAAGVLNSKGPKRITIVPLMELSAQQFVEALSGGIEKNLSDGEIAPLKDRLQTFDNTLLALGKASKGTPIALDWVPGKGTRLVVGGQAKGTPIPGEDFYRALLRIWLGDKPTQGDLKDNLLGKAS